MATGWVKREREFVAIRDVLSRARDGPAGLVIDGDAGSGKTTLWRQAIEHGTEQGFHVIAARGSSSQVRFAYAAVADLLVDVDGTLLDALPDVQRDALVQVQRGLNGDAVVDERLVPAALVSVFRLLDARSPLLIAIDDAHWLDSSSQAALRFACRRLTGRTAVLAATRTAEGDACSWLTLRHADAVHRTGMTALSPADVHALIRHEFGRSLPRPVITRIHDIAAGNPFFTIELARSTIDEPDRALTDLPEDLATLVRRRIGHLPTGTADVALAAASTVAPTVELLGQVTSISTGDVVDALETLESRGVVEIGGNRVQFTHPLFATGIYGAADAARRRATHRCLAAVIDHPELRARHLALASTHADPVAVAALDAAAARTARGAPAAAAELLELAIGLGADDASRLVQVADHHFHSGAFTHARARLETVLEREGSGSLRCSALMSFAALESYCDALPTAVDLLLSALEDADHPAVRLRGLLLLAPLDGITGQLERSMEHARAAVAQARRMGDPMLLSHSLSMWVITSFMCGRGLDDDALSTALAEDVPGSGHGTYQATAVAALIAGWTLDLDRACADMEVVKRNLTQSGDEIHILWAASHLVTFQVWRGRYDLAELVVQEITERAQQMGTGHVMITAHGAMATVGSYTGSPDDVRAAARTAVDIAHGNGSGYLAIAPAAALAFLELSLGNHADALDAVDEQLKERDPALGTEIMVAGYLPDAIEALCELGRVDEAEPLVRELEVNGARLDRPWMLATGARGRSLCEAARGDLAAALRSVDVALAEHERLPMPFETARTRLLAGVLLRRQRRGRAAHAMLSRARDDFERLGTPLWIARATAELDRLASHDAQTAVTAGERRIAERAAAGRSNREIAAELFVSEKTVEANLSRVYRKLGVRSRATLAARLGTTRAHDDDGHP